jgi:sec-independent protein translocase protein TatA
MQTLAFLNSLGTWDMVLLLVLGLLLFGKRLPEVGKSLGKGIVEFKKGLKGVEDDIENSDKDKKDYREQLPPYKAPTSGGQDVRVSRPDPTDQESRQPVSSGHAETDSRSEH